MGAHKDFQSIKLLVPRILQLLEISKALIIHVIIQHSLSYTVL